MSNKTETNTSLGKKFSSLIFIVGIFYTIAIILWLVLDDFFYLINFLIIGTCLALGIGLWPIFSKEKRYKARKLSQALVGGYMFFGLGFGLIYFFFGVLEPENMQLEGFWFWLLAGTFAAGVIHYTIAKIFGTFLFNRGWCGWACWTAAILDYLPWKNSPGRIKKLGVLRYIHFFISIIIILILVFIFGYTLDSTKGQVVINATSTTSPYQFETIWQIPELWWFLGGNILYYLSGIIMAAILKDNRAFCKYLCPITVFMKIGSKYSILKIEGNSEECISCGSCDKACPMDIKVSEYIKQGQRVTSSECILCFNCVNACPKDLLNTTNKIDKEYNKYLIYKNENKESL